MKPVTAFKLWKKENSEAVLKSGCDVLDAALGGGLRKGIIEISGESGTGKTQLAILFILQATLPIEKGGLGGKSVYIATEAFNSIRLQTLQHHFEKKYEISCGDNILLHKLYTRDQQENVIFNELPNYVKNENVKLLVIDSIASFFRFETEYISRARSMNNICQFLKKLIWNFNFYVIFINQVSDLFDTDMLYRISKFGTVFSENRRVKPSLGLAWSNIIDTRIML